MQKGYACRQAGFVPIIILVGILVLASVGGAYYFYRVKTSEPKACTMEAKICPDGPSVGRSGPNCEFSPCSSLKPTPIPDASRKPDGSAPSPASNSTGETANWKIYVSKFQDYSFQYLVSWRLMADSGGVTLNPTKYITIIISEPSVNSGESFEETIPRMQGIISKTNITIGKYTGIKLESENILKELNSYQRTITIVFENLSSALAHGKSGDKGYLTINLEIYDRSQVQEAETIFNKVLTTFRFLK